MLYLRRYKIGSDVAIPYLEEETNVLVRLFGTTIAKTLKYYVGFELWVRATNVWPIHFRSETKWTEAGLSDPKYGDDFRAALQEMASSGCEDLQFKLVGTHDVLFTNRLKVVDDSDTSREVTCEERKRRRMEFAASERHMGLLPLLDCGASSLLMHAPTRSQATASTKTGFKPKIIRSGFSSANVLAAVNDSLACYFSCSSYVDSEMKQDDVTSAPPSAGGSRGGTDGVHQLVSTNPHPPTAVMAAIDDKMAPLLQKHYELCSILKRSIPAPDSDCNGSTGTTENVRNARKSLCPRKIELKRKKKG